MQHIILKFRLFIFLQILIFGQNKIYSKDNIYNSFFATQNSSHLDTIPVLKTYKISKLEIPKLNFDTSIINHTGYSLSYNEIHEQANWVAYELTKEETIKIFNRSNKFIEDPKVKTQTASNNDYKNSGYDRGHLAPAADMAWSSLAMSESFYFSNISPQSPSFNRGIWKKLEELVRTWAVENDAIYIVTGPVLTNNLESIGKNKVSIPNYYYKVILDYTMPSKKGIAFIMPNVGSQEQLQYYAVSIDKVEKLTGIDFFPLLEEKEEEFLEGTLCLDCWSWKKIKKSKSESKNTVSTQCAGITKAQKRCKNKTLNSSGYCYHHNKAN